MLENYRKAIQPQSLLDVVPKAVLQSHMQGFFYGFRAGTVLIYDDGIDLQGKRILKRLEPIDLAGHGGNAIEQDEWRGMFQNFNPFCALFRQRPERNKQCEQCDLDRATKLFSSGPLERIRYDCHMGLIDMTIPILIAGQVRGVLFGGQKIVREDQVQLLRIRERSLKKASEIADQLAQLVEQSALPKKEVDAFEEGFGKFVEAVQATVDAFMDVRRHESEYQTLLTVSQQCGATIAEEDGGWVSQANQLLSELSGLLGGIQFWLLQRRGSRYQCVAESHPKSLVTRSPVPVAMLIKLPLESILELDPGDTIRTEISHRLGIASLSMSVVRSDAPSGGSDVVSLVLVIGGIVQPEWKRLVIGCVRVLAYPAGVTTLIDRLETQRAEHATKASYVGHHLKTPIQSALSHLDEAKRRLQTPGLQDVVDRIENAESQVLMALADAIRLQDAAKIPTREPIDVHSLIQHIVADLAPLAKLREIRVEIGMKPRGESCVVRSFAAQLRVAFTNLVENALKYSFESSWVQVRFSVFAGGQKSKKSQKWLLIEIEDVGVGIPPEDKEALFSLGTRLDTTQGKYARTGSGIGLVQAKEYIEWLGGFLDIDSVLAPFSQSKYKVTVVIHLPLA